MKKLIAIIVIVIALTFTTSSISFAKYEQIEAKITKVMEKYTKTDNERFKIFIIRVPKVSAYGQKFNASVAIMVFADTLDLVDDLVKGDNLKCMVEVSRRDGKPSYVFQDLIE